MACIGSSVKAILVNEVVERAAEIDNEGAEKLDNGVTGREPPSVMYRDVVLLPFVEIGGIRFVEIDVEVVTSRAPEIEAAMTGQLLIPVGQYVVVDVEVTVEVKSV